MSLKTLLPSGWRRFFVSWNWPNACLKRALSVNFRARFHRFFLLALIISFLVEDNLLLKKKNHTKKSTGRRLASPARTLLFVAKPILRDNYLSFVSSRTRTWPSSEVSAVMPTSSMFWMVVAIWLASCWSIFWVKVWYFLSKMAQVAGLVVKPG